MEKGEEREGEGDYVVLGVAVAVSAVATVLTFLICYQVTGAFSTAPEAFVTLHIVDLQISKSPIKNMERHYNRVVVRLFGCSQRWL